MKIQNILLPWKFYSFRNVRENDKQNPTGGFSSCCCKLRELSLESWSWWEASKVRRGRNGTTGTSWVHSSLPPSQRLLARPCRDFSVRGGLWDRWDALYYYGRSISPHATLRSTPWTHHHHLHYQWSSSSWSSWAQWRLAVSCSAALNMWRTASTVTPSTWSSATSWWRRWWSRWKWGNVLPSARPAWMESRVLTERGLGVKWGKPWPTTARDKTPIWNDIWTVIIIIISQLNSLPAWLGGRWSFSSYFKLFCCDLVDHHGQWGGFLLHNYLP